MKTKYKETQWALRDKVTGELQTWTPVDDMPCVYQSRKQARFNKTRKTEVVKVEVIIKEAA